MVCGTTLCWGTRGRVSVYGGEGWRGGGEKGFAIVLVQLNPAYGSLSSFAHVSRITSCVASPWTSSISQCWVKSAGLSFICGDASRVWRRDWSMDTLCVHGHSSPCTDCQPNRRLFQGHREAQEGGSKRSLNQMSWWPFQVSVVWAAPPLPPGMHISDTKTLAARCGWTHCVIIS